ncbi:glycosyltransferase 87 family protein [Streptomyces griseocarneus]|uniref:glycosyltransferase 87 family protein n=1 Tax=Streptomyces griseocarneus TaxID=51201 RepID=UPI00167CA6B2|nr:glycosyltransferase 87 family protein [Streptomyces griseocarneus]MBZ6472029.1 glycosyltransferase 87 family protein [Streptomyces griseocarneus]GHG72113.1 membrane protein [Streptomyces griseocarneus]
MVAGTGLRLSIVVWAVTRAVLMMCVFRVWDMPGSDVSVDIEVIYQGWYGVLRTGIFPYDDVTWQYPPAAALAVLAPGLLPFLDYAPAFFALCLLADAAIMGMLLYAVRDRRRGPLGVWVWVVGVPLLGPIVYARYDVMVTAVAVAALLAAARRTRLSGALVGFGALLKVWPLLLLIGTPRGPRTRSTWGAALVTAGVMAMFFAAAMPGALAFLTFQRDRGTEVESLGSLVFHLARHVGWHGKARLNYGSVEFLGRHVHAVSALALGLSVLAFAWLLLWRMRARRFTATTPYDAAFAAVLLFTTTSRVISPQYMIWLIGLAAVCVTMRTPRQWLPVLLVLIAAPLTQLEFPIWFAHVIASDKLGVATLTLRNGLLVAATVISCRRLWQETVTEPRTAEEEPEPPAERQSALVPG